MLRRGIDYVWAAITPGRSHLDVADTRRPSRGMAFCRWRPRGGNIQAFLAPRGFSLCVR